MTKVIRNNTVLAERVNALLSGNKMDRVLVWLWNVSSGFAAKNVGYPLETSYSDPEKSFWAQLYTTEMYGDDGIPRLAVAGTFDLTWVFGGKIKWPTSAYDMAPSAVDYPVKSEADAQKLKLPNDIKSAGPNPLYFKFAKLLKKYDMPISIFVTSPIEGARSLCGFELLCRWLIKKSDLVHRLLRLVTEYGVEMVRYWVNTFGKESLIIYDSAPTGSNQVMSPKQFESFVFPYQKEFHEKILGLGVKHIFCHICGEQNLNLLYWEQIPMGNPGIISVGHEIDITTAITHFGDTCIIAGNIDPSIIQNGTASQVYDLCRKAIERGKQAPRGYILMPGCGLSPISPPYNVFMMKKAINDFGMY